jgi:hypothetical protein
VTGDGIDTFRDFAPNAPNNLVVLFEYGGVPGLADVRNVQVMVRNVDPDAAKQKAWSIFKELDVPEDRILYLTDTRWAIIAARQTPFKIGVDENNRILWGFNLAITTPRD